MPVASPSVDILIVGAGPVGLTLAMECRRHGASCRIVDSAEAPSGASRAALLHSRTLEALDEMGIAGDALCRGRELRGLALFTDGRQVAQLPIAPAETPFPFLLGLEQSETELLLAQHLRRLGGRVERPVRLTDFAQGKDDVLARLALGDGSVAQVRAAYLVGCDGAMSTVRQGLGLPFPGEEYAEQVLQADVRIRWAAPPPEDHVLAFFGADGALLALPLLPGGCYRVLATLREEVAGQATLPLLQGAMDAWGPGGAALSDPSWLRSYRLQRRLAPVYRVGRALLAGDAAHLQSPLSGQGMNLGIQDAHNLAWKLALVCRGEAPASLLGSYEAERRPMAERTLTLADAVTRACAGFLQASDPALRGQRDQLLQWLATNQNFLGRLSRCAGMLDTRYAPSAIIVEQRAGGDDGAAAALDRGPAPGEHAVDVALAFPEPGADRLLQLVRGRRHTLLLFCGAGTSAVDAAGLSDVGAAVQRRFPRQLESFLVVPHLDEPEELSGPCRVVLDPDAAIHRRYGALRPCVYLLRPDRYVAYRGQPVDLPRLLAYLGEVFTA